MTKVELYCKIRGHRLVSRKTYARFFGLGSEFMHCVRCHTDLYLITED